MLKRPARLVEAADFARVFATRSSVGDRFFRVHFAPGAGGGPRLGLAVSRKVDRRAVARNRIKRQVRESFRQHSSRLPVLDLVVVARPPAAEVSAAQLRRSLEGLWQKLESSPARAGRFPAGATTPEDEQIRQS